MAWTDILSSLFGGGSSGITFPTPTVTGQPGVLADMPDVPATPDVYPGTNTVMPPGSYAPGGGAPGTGFNPASLIGGLGSTAGGIMGLVNQFRNSPTEKALEQAQKLGMQNAQAASKAGQQQLQQYQSGQLSAPQQAAVDQFKQQNLAKWRQYLASAGIPEGSAMADIEAKVNQDAAAYAQSLLQQNYQNSIAALGLGGNTLAQQSVLNLAQEKEIAASQAEAAQAIAQLAGLLGNEIWG